MIKALLKDSEKFNPNMPRAQTATAEHEMVQTKVQDSPKVNSIGNRSFISIDGFLLQMIFF